jgi:CRISPR-associated protein Csx14
LNAHNKKIVAVGFPLVEILAALGLGNARPTKLNALEYRYGVIGVCHSEVASSDRSLFDPNLIRAALGGAPLPFPRRLFRMRLGWPGKEGQARVIRTVTEEVAQ